ncbi:hypothetical protein PN465_01160 [Nodularia spumigena CS-584]|jgi:hypothetical protein|uniref:Uncharacterized protein n=3 Tax=Nodularia spumigena TaxID=70799 RepID=A0A2S0Q003_NODSP|nr:MULTISPECIES: hypothetical protein [Cyanophyceae]MDB9357790.1 hypothetical protein [Nodularia spumigena CS-587/03]AVZ30116.1 hypothetical protein BMF81_01340 [Nodularia spumigena UHCC 0039]EAW43407.1 hypothetical protein N9414_07094 [Nodularia spumigena CCY9414]KZL48804.1 hypothetical protein A2T98_16080 [Nodularia spumigena CENA596]MDB9305304.1 hypothetical protein [Nodularia spumigena CS-591/12]
MSENNTSNNSFLFRSLSEEEQESLAGGQEEGILGTSNFFFQKTDIETEANNNLNLAEDESGSQSTKYTFSQITMASSTTFRLPSFSANRNSVNNFIAKIISGLTS